MYKKLAIILTILLMTTAVFAAKHDQNTAVSKKHKAAAVKSKKTPAVKKADKKAETAEKDKPAEKTSAIPAIKSMLGKFNQTVLKSDFANTKKIVPSLVFEDNKSDNEITLIYSAVDQAGNRVPSLLNNPLAKNMRELIELSFLKMLKAGKAGSYTIAVDTPYFGEGGKVNGSVHYAVFRLKAQDNDITDLEHNKISIWSLIKSSGKLGSVFSEYPH